jgi:imidazolonepropionase-like amidohydrolase
MHALQLEEFTIRAEVLEAPTILKHATTNAGKAFSGHHEHLLLTLILAKLLNRVGKIGAIVAGGFADIIILNSNPLVDVKVRVPVYV